MTRIIAGECGGRTIQTPPGGRTRPTSDRVREALFSQLSHETTLQRAYVLDLYAGSGALGLEALSRGAAQTLFVESAAPVAKVITRNLTTLGADRRGTVRTQAVATALATSPAAQYDVVFLDPPYDLDDDALALNLAALVANEWLTAGAVVIVERSTRTPEPRWPAGLTRFDHRRYGETALWWAETAGEPEPA